MTILLPQALCHASYEIITGTLGALPLQVTEAPLGFLGK